MKKLYLLALGLCCGSLAYGQKVEASLQLNSGVSKFGGEQAAKTTAVTRIGTGTPGYYNNNPYGSRYALTYGGSLQVQRVASSNFLMGTQVGFEQLRSSIEIDRAYGHASHSSSLAIPAEGTSTVKANYMNLQPYLGWRIRQKSYEFDFTLGTDIGFGQNLREEGEAVLGDGTKLKSDKKYETIKADVRPRAGITCYLGSFGATVSYAHGVTNYEAGRDGANSKAYMRVLRAGLLYRL